MSYDSGSNYKWKQELSAGEKELLRMGRIERGVSQPKEKYMPPDHGDICWNVGSETFTRKEVADMLYTQRSMISNDLKTSCGNDLTPDMYKVIDNPRIPVF